ncbi:hypothetical protein BdWA1_002106 [Babesia duncani]|uniref:Uncharacterized protein n=1 Tax=Babesia duncani TaxID=323732 RepID=A0AAD9UPG1_9APIC|nr:hypothetical protein BdWA1_002106 [Babesia duncani]
MLFSKYQFLFVTSRLSINKLYRTFSGRHVITSADGVVHNLTRLALDKCNDKQLLEDATRQFKDVVVSLHPSDILKSLHCFATLGFSNKTILSCILHRIDDLCFNASPRGLNHLLTLFRILNISHESATDPLVKMIKNSLHKFTQELGDIWYNATYLGIDNWDLYELLAMQTQLNFKDLQGDTYRTLEAMSRQYKDYGIFENVNIENLNVKQCIYALAAYTRLCRKNEIGILKHELLKAINSMELGMNEISSLLTLMYKSGIVVPEVNEKIHNVIEHLVNDQFYLANVFPYHALMLAKSTCNSKSLVTMINSAMVVVDKMTPVSCLQLFYTLAILSGNLEFDCDDILLKKIASTHKSLSIKHQRHLYDALMRSSRTSNDSLEKFLKDATPTILPLVKNGMDIIQLEGKMCATIGNTSGEIQPIEFVNETLVLNAPGSKVLSPEFKLHLKSIEAIIANLGTPIKSCGILLRTANPKLAEEMSLVYHQPNNITS